MPKSTRKKKERAADFTKAKLKLGKGKQAAQNVVDTTFKARHIVLPNQSITTEKDQSIPTTRRKLTLNDLLLHTKHYSAATRTDAILGIEELLRAHPSIIESSLASIIQSCSRLIGDDDASVRRAIHGLLSRLFPIVPLTLLRPHAASLLLFTASAQSHIFPEIRIDATKVLDVLLTHIPDAVVAGWDAHEVEGSFENHGAKLLQNLLDLLGVRSMHRDQSISAFHIGSTSKAVILKTLLTFLRHALHQEAEDSRDVGIPTWYLVPSFPSHDAYTAFLDLLRTTQHYRAKRSFMWSPTVELNDDKEMYPEMFPLLEDPAQSWTLHDLLKASTELESTSFRASQLLAKRIALIATLQPLITSTILDHAPVVFSPSLTAPPELDLQLISYSTRLARYLYADILQETNLPLAQRQRLSQSLLDYLAHLAPYFPLPLNSVGRRDIKTVQVFQELNISYCELISFLVVDGHCKGSLKMKSSGLPSNLQTQLDHVSRYALQVLSATTSELQLSPQTFRGLLSTIWVVLTYKMLQRLEGVDPISPTRMFQALVAYDHGLLPHSVTKRISTEFIARFVLIQDDRTEPHGCSADENKEKNQLITDWVTGLPRTLWQVGGNSPSLTGLILLVLLRISQLPSNSSLMEAMEHVRSRLIPYFWVSHPQRGFIPGPYSKLPSTAKSELRGLALNVAHSLLERDASSPAAAELKEAVANAITYFHEQHV